MTTNWWPVPRMSFAVSLLRITPCDVQGPVADSLLGAVVSARCLCTAVR